MTQPIEQQIRQLANQEAIKLQTKINARMNAMREDDTAHFLIYQVLGVSTEEGRQIDLYQNKGRFLYNAAGRFLEKATQICFQFRFPQAQRKRIPNTRGQRPKTFEIDCLLDQDAIEIKWRDATTDGDHITKEHTRIQVIADAGYTPIRVMFYYPNRSQAQKIQQTLVTLYAGVGGHYFYGDRAWHYVKERTNVDLLSILQKIAKENQQ